MDDMRPVETPLQIARRACRDHPESVDAQTWALLAIAEALTATATARAAVTRFTEGGPL